MVASYRAARSATTRTIGLPSGEPVPAGAQFIGDSHDVAIASYDGRVYRWETDVERALDFACQMAGRTLTEEEWEEFVPAQPYQDVCPEQSATAENDR